MLLLWCHKQQLFHQSTRCTTEIHQRFQQLVRGFFWHAWKLSPHSVPLLPPSPPWLSFYAPYLVVWGTLLAFKSISSMEINECEWKWTRAEADMKMWRQCGVLFHILKWNIMCLSEMPLTGLTATIEGFPPQGVQCENHPSIHTHTPRLVCNCFGWGGECWRTHSVNSLIQKCYLCSVISLLAPGENRHRLCQRWTEL